MSFCEAKAGLFCSSSIISQETFTTAQLESKGKPRLLSNPSSRYSHPEVVQGLHDLQQIAG